MSPDRKPSNPVAPKETGQESPWDGVRGLLASKKRGSLEWEALSHQSLLLISKGTIELDGRTPFKDLPDYGAAVADAISMQIYYSTVVEEKRHSGPYGSTYTAFQELLEGLIVIEEKEVVEEAVPDRRRSRAEIAVGRKLNKIVFAIK